MGPYVGDFKLGKKIYIFWSSYGKSGASVTRDTDGTMQIYRDDNTTPKSTANGITEVEDFASITGIHVLTINTGITEGDSGFWQSGHDYFVIVNGSIVDGETVNAVLGGFSIENRFDLNESIQTSINMLPELIAEQVWLAKEQVEIGSFSQKSLESLKALLQSLLNSGNVDINPILSSLKDLEKQVSIIDGKTSKLAFIGDRVKAEIETIEKKIISSSGIKSKTSKITTGIL